MNTRAIVGGFEDRFRVTRLDGKPIREGARYIVLDYSGADPHAVKALQAYAESIESENPQMATDLREAVINPTACPSQHG